MSTLSKREQDDIYNFIREPMVELTMKHVDLGIDSAFGATICTMVSEYCERTGCDVKQMAEFIHQALLEGEDEV